MSDQWTKKLPSLMEGYEEAAPEGLWDAVQAGLTPEKRRPLSGWWYAAAGLAAAAAIVLAVFLWQPAVPVSLVPEDRVAQSNKIPDAIQTPAPVTPAREYLAQAVRQPVADETASPADIPADTPADISADTPADVPVDIPAEPLKPETPVTDTSETAVTQPEETVTEEVPAEEVLPEQWPEILPETPVKKTAFQDRIQLSFTSGTYLARAGGQVSNGFGVPQTPGLASAEQEEGHKITVRMLSRNRASTTEQKHRQNLRLTLGASYRFAPRWSVGTGLSYSVLRSDFSTVSGSLASYTTQHLYYLGVPLSLQFDAFQWGPVSLYLSAGPMLEFAVGARTNNQSYVGDVLASEDQLYPKVKDLTGSLVGGVGFQYRFLKHGALFLQPGVSWHFSGNQQLESAYTAYPVAFDLNFGFRFCW